MQLNSEFVFVCYQPGAGGERLCAWISQSQHCEPLTFYKTAEDRTVITNEYFDKTFLNPVGPFEYLLNTASEILKTKPVPEKINVVPSHWDYELLVSHFAHSKFIRIIHDDPAAISKIAEKKVFGGHLRTLLELKGYCMMYVEEPVFLNLLLQRKISVSMTIGEIHQAITPYITKNTDTKKKFKGYTQPIHQPNVLNVWHNNIDQQQILEFVESKKQDHFGQIDRTVLKTV